MLIAMYFYQLLLSKVQILFIIHKNINYKYQISIREQPLKATHFKIIANIKYFVGTLCKIAFRLN